MKIEMTVKDAYENRDLIAKCFINGHKYNYPELKGDKYHFADWHAPLFICAGSAVGVFELKDHRAEIEKLTQKQKRIDALLTHYKSEQDSE